MKMDKLLLQITSAKGGWLINLLNCIVVFDLCMFGIYLVIRYCEIKIQQKYLPIVNADDMSPKQYKYVLNRISKLIKLYEIQIYEIQHSCLTYISEIKLRENRIEQLYNLKKKLYFKDTTSEDILLLNELLDRRNYRRFKSIREDEKNV